MAIANLHETLLTYTLRRNQLNLEITELQSQKALATYSQADIYSLQNAGIAELREFYKALYDSDCDMQCKYKSYTEIPEFEEEVEKLKAQFQQQLDELTVWETALDAQITTDSAELEEVNAYIESLKSMLSSNIQNDFNYGLNN